MKPDRAASRSGGADPPMGESGQQQKGNRRVVVILRGLCVACRREGTLAHERMDGLCTGERRLRVVQRAQTTLAGAQARSEEHTSELQSLRKLACRLLLEKKRQDQVQTGSISNQRCRRTQHVTR